MSAVLEAEKGRLPEEVAGEIERLSMISSTLYDARGPAMYGDEESGTPPEEIFSNEDAKRSLDQAEDVYKLCKSSLDDLQEEGEMG